MWRQSTKRRRATSKSHVDTLIGVLSVPRITGYFRSAIENVARALEDENSEDVLTLDILPPGERQQLLADFNEATSDYTRTALVHELFEAQVRARPESVALVHRGEVLDYATLNARANSWRTTGSRV